MVSNTRLSVVPAVVPAVPRRDAAARGALAEIARAAGPVALAAERVVPVGGPLGDLLPAGGLRRGSVVVVGGATGAGVASSVHALLAAVTSVGEWVGVVEEQRGFGALAAHEAGVDLERCAVVGGVTRERFTTVLGALLDGLTLVVGVLPAGDAVRLGDARRLAARARDRGGILVVVEPADAARRRARWPAEAAVRLEVRRSRWSGLEPGAGLLAQQRVAVVVDGKDGRRTGELWARAG